RHSLMQASLLCHNVEDFAVTGLGNRRHFLIPRLPFRITHELFRIAFKVRERIESDFKNGGIKRSHQVRQNSRRTAESETLCQRHTFLPKFHAFLCFSEFESKYVSHHYHDLPPFSSSESI